MSRWVKIPPPPLFVLSFLLGVQLQRLLPLPVYPTGPVQAAGGLLIAIAAMVMLAAPILFLARWTTIVPHRNARTLITDGPYRITRNPMYFGLTVGYAGLALLLGHPWSLLFLPFPVWVMHAKVIPFEESTLTRLFGDDYRAYQRRVGRWIGWARVGEGRDRSRDPRVGHRRR